VSCIAGWLISLFTPPEEAESILGDLLEEFSHLASKSGVAFARCWYWRQTVRTIAHLAGAGLRAAPWSTAAAVAGGYVLIRIVFELYESSITAVLDRYRIYEQYGEDYLYWITRGKLIGRVLVATLAGGIVAVLAKGREMTATMTISRFSTGRAGGVSVLHKDVDRIRRHGMFAGRSPRAWLPREMRSAYSLRSQAGTCS